MDRENKGHRVWFASSPRSGSGPGPTSGPGACTGTACGGGRGGGRSAGAVTFPASTGCQLGYLGVSESEEKIIGYIVAECGIYCE